MAVKQKWDKKTALKKTPRKRPAKTRGRKGVAKVLNPAEFTLNGWIDEYIKARPKSNELPPQFAELTEEKQKAIILLLRSMGNVSEVCKAMGISRTWFYKMRTADKVFADACWEVDEMLKDWTETMLKRNIRDGKETSILFYLKCKAKERGYIDRVEHSGTVGIYPAMDDMSKEELAKVAGYIPLHLREDGDDEGGQDGS